MANRLFRAAEGGRHQRRGRAALWIAGGAAALIALTSVNGTLASWTAAIIHNDTNTAGATDSVALSESDDGNATTCVDTSTVADGTNTDTCSAINKYGGNTSMSPGNHEDVDVTFTNTGTGAAIKFGYAPGTCTDTAGSLCSSGHLTVAVTCSAGTTYNGGALIAGLTNAAAAPSSLVDKTGTAVAVASGGSVTCRFTTTVDINAPASDGGASVSQPIDWTLSSV